jgi:putative ABC transport system permease protein
MQKILFDLKLAFRQLRKSPGFTAIAVLMLAFGIGATTAIFSIVDGVLLRSLPFPNANRLVTLGDQVSGTDWGKQDSGPVTGPEVVVYSRDTRSFENLGGYGFMNFELSGIGRPEQIGGSRCPDRCAVFLAFPQPSKR